MIAAREMARQVWVAPANQPLKNVLGLTPSLTVEDWSELFELQFNLTRSEPQDYRVMSAHTLSDDRALLQLSVRRLLIQLRKAALARGMDYTFENNSPQFQEGVRLAMEALLRFMFQRGAFSGENEAQAFRVKTDKSINPLSESNRERFIVEIQVAPSQPMEFITVLLTRAGQDQLFAIEA
jgi:phage tail sheath protein FI